ncbi:MAG: hypothetical protein NC131_11105 [Roseburia sp.]|nr:hypothetical protein [Roseburia sp.]
MLLQAFGKPIMVDGQEAIKDFQLNFPWPQHQLRVKATLLDHTGTGPPELPLDIVVYHFSDIHLDKLNLGIFIDGTEMLSQIEFKVKLNHDFIRHRWRLVGTWNGRPVDSSFGSIVEIFPIIKSLVNPQIKSI